jgi:SRSO17 transposase
VKRRRHKTSVDWVRQMMKQVRLWLLVQQRVGDPTDLTASGVFTLPATTLEAVVRLLGTCWTIESGSEAAQREVGLNPYEVRSWTGWGQHITLAVWALALLTVLRAGAITVDA